MSEDRKLLEDENISVEYDIVNGLVCIDKIYLKEAKEAESNEPLTNCKVTDAETGITLFYSNISKEGFELKIVGEGIYSLEIQRLLVWLSSEYVDYVDILSDKTGLEISMEDFLENGESFTKDFFEGFSSDVVDEIINIKSKGTIKYYIDSVKRFDKSGMIEFRKLIAYINEALI